MAKYSTGDAGGSDGGGACELCGKATERLSTVTVAGAKLNVCKDCASHSDADEQSESGTGSDRESSEHDRKRRAVQNTAKANDVWDGDSSHWEKDGTSYDDDPLPYLVSKYGDEVTAARQNVGLKRDELADELGIPENDLLAVEQGRANQAGIGGGLIKALEERLNVTLSE